MKGGVFSAPGDYIYFKSQVPLHKISVGSKQWRYYDFGPKVVPALICLPGTAGTADVHYKQIMSLSMKGYRVISVDIPRVWNHHEWIQVFEKFLDAIDIHHVHLYGTSLGGFLAQLFAQYRPRRVKSLVLSNSFLDTHNFSSAMPWAPVVSWTPSFLLKRYILTGIRDGPHDPFIADSVDFVVSQVETLSRDDLASRLSLTADHASVGSLLLPDSFITIMDTNDYSAIPQQLKDQVSEKYPGARRAYLKTGGDFPYLSRPDEVNLYLLLHLRRVGVEARPDMVPGNKKDASGGGPSEKIEEGEDLKDAPKVGGSFVSLPENQIPPSALGDADSHNLDEQSLPFGNPFMSSIPLRGSSSVPEDQIPTSVLDSADFRNSDEQQLQIADPVLSSIPLGDSSSILEDQIQSSALDNNPLLISVPQRATVSSPEDQLPPPVSGNADSHILVDDNHSRMQMPS